MKSYERERYEEKIQRLERKIEEIELILRDVIDYIENGDFRESVETIENIDWSVWCD